MTFQWYNGKPTRHFDGRQAAAQLLATEAEFVGKRAFHKCERRFGTQTVVGIMRRCDSMNRFPDWPALAAAFERLAACERNDEAALDAAFCGLIQ